MNVLQRLITKAIQDERGQDMVEYVLIMALVSVVAVGAVKLAGQSVQGLWTTISTSLPAA
jgi:pilus assembly protein Flp/PilA